MKLLVKFHRTFANTEISERKLGYNFFFFFPWKWEVPVKNVFGHFGDFFHGHIYRFMPAIFDFLTFFTPTLCSRALFFIRFTDWKFDFMSEDFVFSLHFLWLDSMVKECSQTMGPTWVVPDGNSPLVDKTITCTSIDSFSDDSTFKLGTPPWVTEKDRYTGSPKNFKAHRNYMQKWLLASNSIFL